MKSLALDEKPVDKIQVEPYRQFDSLPLAAMYAQNLASDLIGNKQRVLVSRIFADRIYKPRSRQIKILGVSTKAGKECERLMPGGKWWVHCDHNKPIDQPFEGKPKEPYFQFMAWYSRYLPYAYAMMTSEDGFTAMGVDYESINSYFKTCMGFVYLGQGECEVKFNTANPLAILAGGGNIEDYLETSGTASVFVKEDMDLFDDCYRASGHVSAPDLPWDEAYRPCFCFVAFQRPELFTKYIQHRGRDRAEAKNDYRTKHVIHVAEYLSRPVPNFKWKR